MKPSENPSIKPEIGVTSKEAIAELADTYDSVNLLGTWSFNNQSTITFYNFVKHAHWNLSQYCCDVNIQKFITNTGHKISEGYWNATIYADSPMYYIHSAKDLIPMFPSSMHLCRDNIQAHGEYHDNISNPLSGCTKMGIDVIDHDHLRLYGPSGVTYLTRVRHPF